MAPGGQGWEPDPRRVGNWRSLFEQPPGGGPSSGEPTAPPVNESPDVEAAANFDAAEYRPWVMQRGRSRPTMLLHLRRYEQKSGLWMGWMAPYSGLYGVEYLGDRMLTLDFGVRQFVLQGHGLDALVGPLQDGAIQAVFEYSAAIWPESAGAVVSTIRRVVPRDSGD